MTVRVVNWLSFKIIENKFYCFTPSRAGDTLPPLDTNHFTALWENYWNQVDTFILVAKISTFLDILGLFDKVESVLDIYFA